MSDSFTLEGGDLVTHSFKEESGGDKISPLKPMSTKKKRPRPTLDISGGIGTPVYNASASNLFDEDVILGKKPLGIPMFVGPLLRLTCSGDRNVIRELFVFIQVLCSLVLGINTVFQMTTVQATSITAIPDNTSSYYIQTTNMVCTLVLYPIVVFKYHSFFWYDGKDELDYDYLDTNTRHCTSMLSLVAILVAVIMAVLGIIETTTTPLGTFQGGFNREWLASTSNSTQDTVKPTAPILFWWIIHKTCFIIVTCTCPVSAATIFPLFLVKSTNQRDLIITMTDDFIGIIKDTDPVTIDIEDIDERQEMFDLLEQKLNQGKQFMSTSNEYLSVGLATLTLYLLFSIIMLTLDIIYPMQTTNTNGLYNVVLLVLFSLCVLIIINISLRPDIQWQIFINSFRNPATVCRLSYPGFNLTEFILGLEARKREYTWVLFGVQMNGNFYVLMWSSCVVLLSVVVAVIARK